MNYKFQYKDEVERNLVLKTNSNLFLVEEQNITEGNFLIFVDASTYKERKDTQELNLRISLVNQYLTQDNANLTNIENSILEIEKNKILGGM